MTRTDMRIGSARGMQKHGVSHMLQGQLEEDPHMRVGQRIVGDPAVAFDFDDPMGAQQAQRVRNSRLAQLDHGGNVPHRHPARQQGDQDANTSGIAEQAEHIGQVDDFSSCGHARPDLLHLLRVNPPRHLTRIAGARLVIYGSHNIRLPAHTLLVGSSNSAGSH